MDKKEVNKLVMDILSQCQPLVQLEKYLPNINFHSGKLIVISIGKAAWQLASGAVKYLNKPIDKGVILTKYNHSQGKMDNFTIYEASHPLIDENALIASEHIISLLKELDENDDVIFLISGGGSALLESPFISLDQLQKINEKLLSNSVNIYDINLIRKKLSKVKAGRLAKLTNAHIHNFILSDVIGSDLTVVASGPTLQSEDNIKKTLQLNKLYDLNIPKDLLLKPFPKLDNIFSTTIIGSNQMLAEKAKQLLDKLGYDSNIITTTFTEDISLLKEKISSFINKEYKEKKAFIFSGEPTITIKGSGKGGRCQHLISLLLKEMAKTKNSTLIAFGSDGTDGPTEAAGAYCDSKTINKNLNIDIDNYINNFDSYHLLKQLDCLIFTGPTGTNINDLYLLLID